MIAQSARPCQTNGICKTTVFRLFMPDPNNTNHPQSNSLRGEKNHCCASNGQKCAQGEEGKGERCASEARIFVRTRKFPQEKEWETRRKRGRTEERTDARMRDFRMISHCPAAGNSIHIGKAEQSERGEKNHCCASNGQKCAQGEEGKGERCASEARIFVRTRKFPQAIVYILAREVTRCGRISALLRHMARVFPLHKSKTPAFASVSGPLPEYYKGLRNQHRMGKFAFGLARAAEEVQVYVGKRSLSLSIMYKGGIS